MSVRWSQEEYRQFLRRGNDAPFVSEKAWQTAVLRLLKQHDYVLVFHTFDARRSPSGFPDLIAVHKEPGRPILAIELKTDAGQVTPAQQAWIEALAGCTGVVAEVWKPAMLQEIVARLRDPTGQDQTPSDVIRYDKT